MGNLITSIKNIKIGLLGIFLRFGWGPEGFDLVTTCVDLLFIFLKSEYIKLIFILNKSCSTIENISNEIIVHFYLICGEG